MCVAMVEMALSSWKRDERKPSTTPSEIGRESSARMKTCYAFQQDWYCLLDEGLSPERTSSATREGKRPERQKRRNSTRVVEVTSQWIEAPILQAKGS